MTAHIRTGAYDPSRSQVTASGRSLPWAVTICDAEPTGPDFTRPAALTEIIEGGPRLAEMCPACRARIEAETGARPMAHFRGRITGPQEAYLRRLLIEARGRCRDVPLDHRRLEGVSARYAAFAIERLKRAKVGGWAEAA